MKIILLEKEKKMSKLYTKTGDKGTTSLYDERNVPKFSEVFNILGGLDEISAHLGMVASLTDNSYTYLRKIQTILLDIGSYISTNSSGKIKCTVSEEDIKEIESFIDEYQEKVPPLREFILPGVNMIDSTVQVCRAVTRRVERDYWKHISEIRVAYIHPGVPEMYTLYEEKEPFFLIIGKYINRLSDYLFALARVLCEGKETTRSQATSSFHRPQVKTSKDASSM